MAAKREDIDDFEVRWKYEVLGWTQQKIADYYGTAWSTIHFRLHPEKKKESNKQWNLEHPEKKKENNKQWRVEHSEEIKESNKQWNIEHPEYNKQWQQEHPEYKNEWWQSDVGKETARRHNAERRELGCIELNEPFENSEGHHIDETYIIHIPKEIHQSIYHNLKTGQGMEDINAIAFGYITEETFNKLIAEEI